MPTTPAKLPSPTVLRPLVNPLTALVAASAPVINLFKPKAAGKAASARPLIALPDLSTRLVSIIAGLVAPPVVAPGPEPRELLSSSTVMSPIFLSAI